MSWGIRWPPRRHIPLELRLIPLPDKVEKPYDLWWEMIPAFVEELAAFLDGKRVLETFAGRGYLAALLAQRGIDIVSTTVFTGHDSHDQGLYYPVEELPSELAVVKYGDERDVLLFCWPVVTDAVFNSSILWGTDRDIVFIGEISQFDAGLAGLGGCASDEFFMSIEITHRFESYKGNRLEGAVVCRLKNRG